MPNLDDFIWAFGPLVESCESWFIMALDAWYQPALFVWSPDVALQLGCDVGSCWAEGPKGRGLIMSNRYWGLKPSTVRRISWRWIRGKKTILGKVWCYALGWVHRNYNAVFWSECLYGSEEEEKQTTMHPKSLYLQRKKTGVYVECCSKPCLHSILCKSHLCVDVHLGCNPVQTELQK